MTPRQVLTVLLVLALLASAYLVVRNRQQVAAIIPYNSTELRLFQLTNRARILRGLPQLRRALGGLHTFARSTARRLANTGALVHSKNKPCVYWGENIGSTPTGMRAVFRAFMDSESHRNNILNRNFTRLGMGTYKRGDIWWIAAEFCR